MEFSGGGRTRPTWMPARLPCESRTWVVLGLFCRHRRRRLGIRGPLTFRSSRDHAVSIPTSYSSHPPDPLFFFSLFLPIDSPTPLVPYYQQALALLISVDRFDCVLHLFSSARFTLNSLLSSLFFPESVLSGISSPPPPATEWFT